MSDLAVLVQAQRLALLEDSVKTYVAPDLPRKKALNAIVSYAPDVTPDAILVLFDDTLWGSADNGLILTETTLHARALMGPIQRIALADIREIRAHKTTVLVNGTAFIDLVLAEKLTVLRFCNLLNQFVARGSVSSAPATPAPAVQTEAAPAPNPALMPTVPAVATPRPSHGFPRNRPDSSYFFQYRAEFARDLRLHLGAPDAGAMYLALYDAFLAVATGLKALPAPAEEMAWLVHDDEVLFQAYILLCFNVGQMLSEHMDEDDVHEFLFPLLMVMLSVGLKEQGQQPPTLASAINPLKALMATPRMQEFKTCHEHYKAAYGFGQHGTSGMCSWFTLHCVDRLRQKYGEDFVAVQAECLKQGQDFQDYLHQFAAQLRPRTEGILIRFFAD